MSVIIFCSSYHTNPFTLLSLFIFVCQYQYGNLMMPSNIYMHSRFAGFVRLRVGVGFAFCYQAVATGTHEAVMLLLCSFVYLVLMKFILGTCPNAAVNLLFDC